jgi:PAS domain S-box-containing protein
LARLLNRVPEGVLVVDERRRIVWANRWLVTTTGWPATEIRGMRLDRLIPRDELGAIARARGVPDPWALRRYHCFVTGRDGTRSEVSVSAGLMARAGRSSQILLLRDTSRQRDMERRLLERLTEMQRLEAPGRLVWSVVHDLRKLNNTLGLAIQNFRRHPNDPLFLRDGLAALEAVARQLEHMLIQLSRSPQGGTSPRQLTTLPRLVEAALDVLAGLSRRANVRATVVRWRHAPLPCAVDAVEVQRVLVNLLLNAYDAVKAGGKVFVIGTSVGRGRGVRLVIEDTGPGIPKGYRERFLFRPFRSTKVDGLGLGLYHAKSVIEAHGGALELSDRAAGKGARVTITLPPPGESRRARPWPVPA